MGYNGGAIAQRGFIFQSIIAMIECLKRTDWNEIKIEPEKYNNKVDIILYKDGSILSAIQVKSSSDSFERSEVSNWLDNLKRNTEGDGPIYLYLVGDSYTPSCETFIGMHPEIKKVPFEHLQDICTGALVNYISNSGLSEDVRVADLELLDADVFTKIHKNSIADPPISRAKFESTFQKIILLRKCTSILRLIDTVFINEHIVDKNQYERCRFDYYFASKSFDSVFKAVINGLSATTSEYENIFDRLYDTVKTNPVLIIMAEGGTGKSTLLAKVAARLAIDGYPVYYSDSVSDEETNVNQILSFTGQIEQDTYFLIDNASKNPALISNLYLLTETNRYVHVIVCDRLNRVNALINNLDVPGWLFSGKGIVLKNSLYSYSVSLPSQNTVEIELSVDLRKTLAEEAINAIARFNQLDPDICRQIRQDLQYDNHSITDIILDFCIAYNSNADKSMLHPKIIRLDWDEWDDITGLRGSFKYLAALTLYGVNVTTRQMEKLTGVNIDELVANGKLQVVRLHNDVIRLKHDTVADNYFKVKYLKPHTVIEDMLENRLFTEDTLVAFEKDAFSIANIITTSSEIESLCIPKLVKKFNSIEEYRHILEARHRIHSLEFALLALSGKDVNASRIGKSYVSVQPFYTNYEWLWMRYFIFTVYHADTIPDELFPPLLLNGLYKKVTKNIDRYIRTIYRNLNKDDRNKWINILEQLFTWIISNTNQNDVPSRILLLWVYQHSGRLEKAKKYLIELTALDDLEINASELSISYIQIYEKEVRQLLKKDRSDSKIRETNTFIRNYYKNLIKNTDDDSNDYVTIIRSYMRFQKSTGHYDEAYSIGTETIKRLSAKQIALYRIYIEMGMICQRKNKRNDYFNHENAIDWFKKAVSEIESSSRELLYALKPLCKSYLYVGNYVECIKVCKLVKSIDAKDFEVPALECDAIRLHRITDLKLPIGDQYDWRLKPEKEQEEEAFEKLLIGMTDEQLMFAELFQIRTLHNRYYAFRIAFSIKNNTYIPISILSKMRISDERRLGLLIDDSRILVKA